MQGGVDPEDEIIRDAVAREVKEETGLTVSWVIQQIGNGVSFFASRGVKVLKLTFVVEIHEIETLSDEAKVLTESSLIKARIGSDSSKNPTEAIPVVLSASEHQNFVWATRDQVVAGATDAVTLDFASPDQKAVMLEAFDIQEHIVAAKASI